MRYTEDFLFSENEKDMMLGLLLVHNKNNRLAFEYLLAYTLLNRDIASFLKYYPIGKNMGYAVIPRSYQEALVYVWTQSHPNFQGMPLEYFSCRNEGSNRVCYSLCTRSEG